MDKLRNKLLAIYQNRTGGYQAFCDRLGISDTFFWRLEQGGDYSLAVAIAILQGVDELPFDYDFSEAFTQSLEEYFIDKSVAEVGRLTGLNSSTMHEWKKGNNIPLNSKFSQYCDYLEIEVYDFLIGSASC